MTVAFHALDPKKHISPEDQHPNSEENTKIKFVVPYLRHLGWDLRRDLWFEVSRADIVVRLNGRPFLVVEVKSWGFGFTDAARKQVLEYAVEHGTPWTLFANGDTFRLFHALALRKGGPRALRPLAETRFSDLKQGSDLVGRLIRKVDGGAGGALLQARAAKSLGFRTWMALERKWDGFRKRRRPGSRTPERMTPDRLEACLKDMTPKAQVAYRHLYRGLRGLDEDFDIARLEWESKSVGLRVRDPISERNRWLGVFGLYPKPTGASVVVPRWGFAVDRLTQNSLNRIRPSLIMAAAEFKKSPSRRAAIALTKLIRKVLDCAEIAYKKRSRLQR